MILSALHPMKSLCHARPAEIEGRASKSSMCRDHPGLESFGAGTSIPTSSARGVSLSAKADQDGVVAYAPTSHRPSFGRLRPPRIAKP